MWIIYHPRWLARESFCGLLHTPKMKKTQHKETQRNHQGKKTPQRNKTQKRSNVSPQKYQSWWWSVSVSTSRILVMAKACWFTSWLMSQILSPHTIASTTSITPLLTPFCHLLQTDLKFQCLIKLLTLLTYVTLANSLF